MLQGPDGYVFQLSTTEEIQKQTRLEELGDEDMIVYQCIEASGDQGIWIRDIKVQTSLHAVNDIDSLTHSRLSIVRSRRW